VSAAQIHLLGVFVTREHIHHNKSDIAQRGRTRINSLKRTLAQVKPLCSGGQVTLPSRTGEPCYTYATQCTRHAHAGHRVLPRSGNMPGNGFLSDARICNKGQLLSAVCPSDWSCRCRINPKHWSV
jgi:hypothetical protein